MITWAHFSTSCDGLVRHWTLFSTHTKEVSWPYSEILVSAFNRGPVWVVVTKGAEGADRVGSLYSRFLERRYQGRDILNKGSQTKLHPDTNLDQAEWFWPAQDSDTFDARWNYLRQANGPIPDLPYHLDQISSPPNIRLCPPSGYTSSTTCLWFGLRQIQILDW